MYIKKYGYGSALNHYASWCIVFLISMTHLGILEAQEDSCCSVARDITKTVEKYHVDSRPLDDSLSASIFDLFLEELDPFNSYFTQSEYDQLLEYKYGIDDEIKNQQCELVSHVAQLLTVKFEKYHQTISNLSARDFDYSIVDTLYIQNSQRFAEEELLQSIKKRIKLMVLYSVVQDSSSNNISNEEYQEKTNDYLALELCQLEKKIGDESLIVNYVSDEFLKAISQSYDPHTSYLTESDLNEFQTGLSKVTHSFGITVAQNDQGQTRIVEVLPGSSAWRSGLVDNGDVITGVENEDGELLELNCLLQSDITSYLSHEELEHATFYIKKIDGSNSKVELDKEEVLVSENIIESFILEGEHRIAYIELPSFYVGESDNYTLPNGCANDVAKELLKLQKENIDGLILDLRYNGGGAIQEAIRMAGMFINYGAVAIEDYKGERPRTIKDMDRGTVYDGPLLVLVGGFSASASELFSAAMQDHNRAIVVGGQTFGKSTIQTFVPVNAYDEVAMSDTSSSDVRLINLTIGRYYRVTGETLQNVGVEPDIDVPGILDLLDVGESTYPHTLEIQKVNKKTYYWPLDPLPIHDLQLKSKDRLDANIQHQEQLESFGQYAKIESIEKIPISYEFLEEIYNLSEEKDLELEEVFSLRYPEYREDFNIKDFRSVTSSMKNDFQIREAYHIINDLISIDSK